MILRSSKWMWNPGIQMDLSFSLQQPSSHLFFYAVTHSCRAKMGTVNLQELFQKASPKHTMQQKQPKEQIWEELTDLIWHFGLAWARAWKRPPWVFSFLHWCGYRDVLPWLGCFWFLTHTLSQVIFSPGSESTSDLTKVYLPVWVTDHGLAALRMCRWFPYSFITCCCSGIHGLCKHDSHCAPFWRFSFVFLTVLFFWK